MNNIDDDFSKNAPALVFSAPKQKALLYNLLVNKEFFLQSRSVIKPSHFSDPMVARLWEAALLFFETNKVPPHVDGLLESTALAREDQATKNQLKLVRISLKDSSDKYSLTDIRTELDYWLKGYAMKESVLACTKLFNTGDFTAAFSEIRNLTKNLDNISFQSDKAVDMLDFSLLEQEQIDMRGALTFGLSAVDNCLLPYPGAGGGLLPGDQTLILGSTNAGKSTVCVTICVANAHRDKHILLMTHEGRPADITQKIWRAYLSTERNWAASPGITKEELFRIYNQVGGPEFLQEQLRDLKQRITYIPMNKAFLAVEEVESEIRRAQDTHVAKYGRGFDLIASDYPAKLITQQNRQGHMQTRHVLESVYNVFTQLALEFNSHSLVLMQTNREGSKVNRGQGDTNRLLTPEDAAEAFGPMQIATNVISINRSPEAERRGYVTFHVGKSRSNEKGQSIKCKTRYDRSVTHADAFGTPIVWIGDRDSNDFSKEDTEAALKEDKEKTAKAALKEISKADEIIASEETTENASL